MTKAGAVGRAVALAAGAVAGAGVLRRRRPLASVALLAGAGLAARGAFSPASPVFGRVLDRGDDERRMALTFDDGPGPSTGAVLDALARAGARATFFALGRQIVAHPHLARRIVEEGHQLASHGYDHGILVFRGSGHVRDQLLRTEEAADHAAGPGAMTRLFRAPHGFRGPTTVRTVHRLGYRTVGWSAGVFDSADPGVEAIVGRATEALGPGAILLLHDADGWAPERDRTQTAAAVPGICAAAHERGLALVRLDEMTLV